MRSSPMPKCSRDRCVCAPHSLSVGTVTGPRLSCSRRVEVIASPLNPGGLFREWALRCSPPLFRPSPARLKSTGRAGGVGPGAVRRSGGITRDLRPGRDEPVGGKGQPPGGTRLTSWYECGHRMACLVLGCGTGLQADDELGARAGSVAVGRDAAPVLLD